MHVKDDSAARLRVLMAERDVRVGELADMTGISREEISRLRSGKIHVPNHEGAYRIAQALGVRTSSIWPNR